MSKLQTKLARLKESFKEKIPADVGEKMHQATVELQQSGAEENVLKESDSAPDFTLNNQDGESRTLQGLTADGPLVITFYRGQW